MKCFPYSDEAARITRAADTNNDVVLPPMARQNGKSQTTIADIVGIKPKFRAITVDETRMIKETIEKENEKDGSK